MSTPLFAKQLPAEIRHGTFFERNVSVDKMFVHYRTEVGGYARALNQRRLAKLIDEFDQQALGVLLLSMRNDGNFAIIDGQHRVQAAAFHGISGVDAYVYIDLTLQDEARLYRKFGDYLKQTARDKFLAALAEGQPEIVAINRILIERGLRVGLSSGKNDGVAAVDRLIHIAQKYGPHVLRQTIHLLHDAWGGDGRAYSGSVLTGAAMFIARFEHNANFKRQRLVERMHRQGIDGIEQLAMHQRALQKGDPGSAWGKALLANHDYGIPNLTRLGLWPEMHYSEESRAKVAAAAALGNRNRPAKQRSEGSRKGWATRKANTAAANGR